MRQGMDWINLGSCVTKMLDHYIETTPTMVVWNCMMMKRKLFGEEITVILKTGNNSLNKNLYSTQLKLRVRTTCFHLIISVPLFIGQEKKE